VEEERQGRQRLDGAQEERVHAVAVEKGRAVGPEREARRQAEREHGHEDVDGVERPGPAPGTDDPCARVAARTEGGAVGEARGHARHEDEALGRVREAPGAQGVGFEGVGGRVGEEDRDEREAAQDVEPGVAGPGSRGGVAPGARQAWRGAGARAAPGRGGRQARGAPGGRGARRPAGGPAARRRGVRPAGARSRRRWGRRGAWGGRGAGAKARGPARGRGPRRGGPRPRA
jgi:hypothetical protein